MIHEPRGAGTGQSTHPLSPSEKIAHCGNRTRGSFPWPGERQPTELPPPPPPRGCNTEHAWWGWIAQAAAGHASGGGTYPQAPLPLAVATVPLVRPIGMVPTRTGVETPRKCKRFALPRVLRLGHPSVRESQNDLGRRSPAPVYSSTFSSTAATIE